MNQATLHSSAPPHLPVFITPPGEADILMYVVGVVLFVILFLIGSFYFRLHALPEQIAHRGEKIQFEIVAVLALLALFTHNHLYWIAALLLAFIPIPDFSTPLQGIAASLARMANATRSPRSTPALAAPERVAVSADQTLDAIQARPSVGGRSETQGHA